MRRTAACLVRSCLLGGLVAACGSDADWSDSGTLDASVADAGPVDAGAFDAGAHDAGKRDAGLPDAGSRDAGTSDAGTPDAGTSDAGTSDAGTSDAGTSDAGTSDAGTSDAGTSDAGTSDAGTSDAGTSDAGPRLRWRPPPMDAGTWLALALSTTDECLTLDDTKNYVLTWPSTPKRGFLRLSGGGHVVMVGGHSRPENRWPKDVPACGVSSTNAQPRAVHIQDGPATPPNRVVHVEGLLVEHQAMADGGRAESDAFGSGPESAEKTILQLQNVRVKNLQGSEMGVHADAVQVHGGFAGLRIDRMTIESQYNALYLRNTPRSDCSFAAVGPVDLRHVNVTGVPVQGLRICSGACIATCNGGASVCACGDDAGTVSCTAANWAAFASTVKGVGFGRRDTAACPIGEAGEYPTADVTLQDVWLAPYGGLSFGNFVYPDRGHSVFPVDVTTIADAGFWPALQSPSPSRGKVTGQVTRGVPVAGDYCPSSGCAGLGYRSPGYLSP